jgi:hypothetical protein
MATEYEILISFLSCKSDFAVLYVVTDVSEIFIASIFSINFYCVIQFKCTAFVFWVVTLSTRRYNPEDQHRHVPRRENLKSHKFKRN